ncbi:basic salivary proline-rich protein 4-like [Dunckerocampus dactyliophorus]|uniref:basic salivary proline-rich protein 4-like n=1 Tax=Dunckerocampus dactyliophorus TaxID=161453 RepID=UPI002405F1D6|nr:basic salivary proline-rich protein 4-like [Dunckerocampus dactyliophorus]
MSPAGDPEHSGVGDPGVPDTQLRTRGAENADHQGAGRLQATSSQRQDATSRADRGAGEEESQQMSKGVGKRASSQANHHTVPTDTRGAANPGERLGVLHPQAAGRPSTRAGKARPAVDQQPNHTSHREPEHPHATSSDGAPPAHRSPTPTNPQTGRGRKTHRQRPSRAQGPAVTNAQVPSRAPLPSRSGPRAHSLTPHLSPKPTVPASPTPPDSPALQQPPQRSNHKPPRWHAGHP